MIADAMPILTLTEEQEEIQSLAQDYAGDELRARSAEWDEAGMVDSELFVGLAELGFLGMRVPEANGGLGFDALTTVLAIEALAAGDAGVTLALAAHNGPVCEAALALEDEVDRGRLLGGFATGDYVGGLALSSPSAGEYPRYDPDITTVQGRLTGRSEAVIGAAHATHILLRAQSEDGDCLVLVELGSEPLDGDPSDHLGLRSAGIRSIDWSETSIVKVDSVPLNRDGVSEQDSIGNWNRLLTAAVCLGLSSTALEHAVQYAQEREQFGHPIAEFGEIQGKVARMAVALAGARTLTYHAAGQLQNGLQDGSSGSPTHRQSASATAKLAAAEAAAISADEAVQILGGYGYMRDYPVEKLLRDSAGLEVFGGEVTELRRLIAAGLFE